MRMIRAYGELSSTEDTETDIFKIGKIGKGGGICTTSKYGGIKRTTLLTNVSDDKQLC